MKINQIQFLMEFLKSPIKPMTGEILTTLNKATIRKLCESLNISNIRFFLYDTIGRKIHTKQVLGTSEIWDVAEIGKIKQDVAIYKKLHFIKIYYFNDENKQITLGFLGVYREKALNNAELGLLQLFCRLYADSIKKRITLTLKNKNLVQLTNVINIAKKEVLPGSIISKTLESIHRSANAYASYYVVLDDKYMSVDYVKKGSFSVFYPKSQKIILQQTFLNKIKNGSRIYKVSDRNLKKLYKSLEPHIPNINDNFLLYIYPAILKQDLLGFWMFIFSDKQFFDKDELRGIIEISDSLVNENYKYLYQRKTKKMIVNPIFRNRETRISEKDIFTLMPFTLEWSNRIYNNMIKPTIEKCGFTAKRADDLYGQDIMEDIWSSILSSKLIIADITARNPNVFYELGIAHTLGKNVILLSQNVTDIPFDLNRYRHIIYEDNYDGYEVLKNKLENAIKELAK